MLVEPPEFFPPLEPVRPTHPPRPIANAAASTTSPSRCSLPRTCSPRFTRNLRRAVGEATRYTPAWRDRATFDCPVLGAGVLLPLSTVLGQRFLASALRALLFCQPHRPGATRLGFERPMS